MKALKSLVLTFQEYKVTKHVYTDLYCCNVIHTAVLTAFSLAIKLVRVALCFRMLQVLYPPHILLHQS